MKSHVGLGYNVCPICYQKHNEVVLLDKRLKNSLERDNFLGFEICPEHKAMEKEYVGLVVVKNDISVAKLTPKNAEPTGNYAMLRREAAKHLLKIDASKLPLFYIDQTVFNMLIDMEKQANEEREKEEV